MTVSDGKEAIRMKAVEAQNKPSERLAEKRRR